MKDYPFNPNKCFKKSDVYADESLYHKYIVRCPICGCEEVHIKGTILENGDDNYKSSAPVFRGNLVKVQFECEEWHTFETCFAFHKGNTFAFFRDPRNESAG